jgi:hypothetical protein
MVCDGEDDIPERALFVIYSFIGATHVPFTRVRTSGMGRYKSSTVVDKLRVKMD